MTTITSGSTGTDSGDKIVLGGGNDTIDGGLGSDTINAGAGNDTLIYTYANEARVVDYYNGGSGSDTLVLDFSKYTQWTQASWSTFEAALTQRIVEFKAMVEQYKAANGNLPNTGSKDFVFDFGNGTKLQVSMTEKVVVVAPVLNTAPVITSGAQAGAAQEDGTLVVRGTVTATDTNTSDVLTYSGNATGEYGSFSVAANGVWTYTLANGSNGAASKVQSLAEGEIQTETFTVTVSDDKGATATQSVKITITGTNDAPFVRGAVSKSADEDGTPVPLDALAGASDVDNDTKLQVNVPQELPAGVTYDADTHTFTLDPGHTDYQTLGEGVKTTVVVNYGISDGLATTSKSVQWVVTGTNDDPKVVGAVTGSATEDGAVSTLDAFVNIKDADTGDELTVVFSAGDTSSDPATAAAMPAGLGGQTTTVSDASPTPSDLTSGLTPGGAGGDPNVIAFDPQNPPPGITYDEATHSFSLNPSNEEFQSLGEGETRTVTISYFVSDGKTTIPATLQWVVTGTNDVPQVVSAVTGSAIEDNDVSRLHAFVNIKDLDARDVLTVVFGAGGSDPNVIAFNPDQPPPGVTYDPGTQTFSLDPSHSAFQNLGEGETRTVTISYSISDARATIPITLQWVVTGTNDAPQVVSAVTGSATEDGAVSTLDAFVNIKDLDTRDVLTVVFTAGDTPIGSDPAAVVAMPAGLDGQTTTVSDVSPTPSDLTARFTSGGAGGDPNVIAFDPKNPPPGITYDEASHSFSLNPSDKEFQSLGVGETRTVTISYFVSDGKTTTPATLQWVVTGTNDVPFVLIRDGDSASADLTEGNAGLTASGSLSLIDPDVTDAVDARVIDVTAVTAYTGALPSTATLLDFFTATSTDTRTTAVTDLRWEFDAKTEAFDFLSQDQELVLTYTVEVNDKQGGTVTQDVTITITGTNDAPVVSGAFTGVAIEGWLGSSSGALDYASDEDNDALQVVNVPTVLPGGVTYDAATHQFALDPSHSAYQSLAAGATKTVSVTYYISDGMDTVPTSVQWTVTGTNDTPVVSGAVTGVATEDGAVSRLNALDNARDVDVGNTLQMVGVLGTLPAGVTYDALTQTFSLDPSASAYQGLTAGETETVGVIYFISDGTDTVPASVQWTVTGTNDAPTVAVTNPPTTPELPNASAQSIAPVTGTLALTDLDIGNTLQVSLVGDPVLTFSGGSLTTAESIAQITALTPLLATNKLTLGSATPSNGGTVNVGYTWDPAAAALDFLANGQTLTVTYAVQVGDSTTTSVAQNLAFTITGTNDAPTLAITNPAAIPELANASAQNIAAVTGTLTVTDLDVGNTLQVSLVGNPVLAFSGALTPAQITALTSALATNKLTLGYATPSNGGTVNVGYTWDPAAAALDFLANGQKLTVTYAVQVTDGIATSPTQNLVFTITGANDAPTLASTNPAAIPELADASAQTIEPVSGTLPVTDLDVGNTLQVSLGGNGVLAFSGGSLTTTQTAELTRALITGRLTLIGTTDFSNGGGVNSFRYTWEPVRAALDFLGNGQTLTVTYAVQVSDGITTSQTQNLVFTITGTNDAPTVTAGAQSVALVEAGAVTTATVTLSKADVDGTASFDTAFLVTNGWSTTGLVGVYSKNGTYGGAVFDLATGVMTYTLDNSRAATQNIAPGRVVGDNFAVGVIDDDLATGSANALFQITGANGRPSSPTFKPTYWDSTALPGANDPIGIFRSIDPDGEPLQWIVEGSSGFSISSSGVLTRDGGLSFYTNYTLNVFAKDFSSLSNPLAVNIVVGNSLVDTSFGSVAPDLIYAANTVVYAFDGNDTVFGSSGNGLLDGGWGDDLIYGAGGNDSIKGDDGNDTLYGGLGNDTLEGGLGDNDFVFDTALGPTNVDRIRDFNEDNDQDDLIVLDNDIFTAFGTRVGHLTTADFQEFTVASSALQSQVLTGTSPRIVVNLRTGGLADVYYDADGGSLSNATLFATVDYGAADKPRYNDFTLID